MMGILYSGNFYTIIDTKSPAERAKSIIETLESKIVITDQKNISKLEKINLDNKEIKVLLYEDLQQGDINQEKLEEIRKRQIDLDPMYVVFFTSGSTGIQKEQL